MAKRNIRSLRQGFYLRGEDIDKMAAIMEEAMEGVGIKRANRLRIRLSMEESLLRMRSRFGEKSMVRLTVGSWFGTPYIQIEKEGEIYNPLSKEEVYLEDWSGSMMTSVGLFPQYSYVRGINTIRLILPKTGVNPGLKVLSAIVVGILCGLLIKYGLSVETQQYLTDALLRPLDDLWIRILTVLSGPVIFIMVLTTILNMGNIGEEGASTRKVIGRYMILSLMAAMGAVAISSYAAQVSLDDGASVGQEVAKYLSRSFRIVPDNIVEPFAQSNTPQILLIAFLIGNAMVIAGHKTDRLQLLVQQCNTVGLKMTEWVSRAVPYFTAALICYDLVDTSLETFRIMWKVMLLSLVIAALFMLVMHLRVSHVEKVPFWLLVRKIWPHFVTTFLSGSLDKGYGVMERSCFSRLGIERHFTRSSLPHGLVLYMPINIIGTLTFTIFAAQQYDVRISVGWIIVAIVLAVVMFVATPPVPGANLLAYIMIFGQLGVPKEALVAAMVFDILYGIFATAGNQTMVQLDLIRQADKMGLLDKDILRWDLPPRNQQ